MIIDSHTHVWPEKIAQKAKDYLEKVFKTKLVCLPTVDNLLGFMDRNEISASFVSSVASRPEQVASINAWLKSIKSGRIKIMAAFHPFSANWREELKILNDFASGIKLQPEFQEFYVDDEKIFKVYEKIQEAGLPVLFHCGQELSGTMVVRSSPERMKNVIEKFPGLKIIAAHFGGFRMWDEVEKHLIGRNIYMDTAYTFSFLEKSRLTRLMGAHGVDKILFGTDFPLTDQKADIEYINSMGLNPEIKEKIFSRNAAKLFSR